MRILDLFSRRRTAEDETFQREMREDGTLSLTRLHLDARGTRDLRIDGLPPELEPAARDLLERLTELAARQALRNDGETVGGPLVDETQLVMHMATLRLASRDAQPGADEIFRVVDYGADVASGLPRQLLATHLAMWNRAAVSRRVRIDELAWSVCLYPGLPADADMTFAFDRGENVGNWAGWNALGELLVEAGDVVQGLDCLREATLRCPPWAEDFAKHVGATVARTGVDTADDPRLGFWLEYARRLAN